MARADDELADKERADIIATHALAHSEHWMQAVGEMAQTGFAEAVAAAMSPDLSDKKRWMAIGAGKAWEVLVNLPEASRKAYEELVESERAEKEEAEDVGSKLDEQWYEKVT